MAVNKKDDKRFQNLTVDYRSLMRLNVSERMNMINSVEGRSLVANIEPEQVAAAFPNYYRKDTNAFGKKLQGLMSSPDTFTKPQSGDRSGLSESNRSALGVGRRRSDVGAQAQLSKEQKETYDLLQKGKIDADDPRVGFLKSISEADLKKFGINAVTGEDGKKSFAMEPTKASQMTDEELSARSASGKYAAKEGADEKQRAIVREANRLGISPSDLATVISYETGGKFSTSIPGGKGGNHMGLIQFGEAERKQFGVHANQTFDEQMKSAGDYLETRGLSKWLANNPNATEAERRTALYSTINAGKPDSRYWGRTDNGGRDTVASHTNKMFGENSGHVKNAQSFLAGNVEARPPSREEAILEETRQRQAGLAGALSAQQQLVTSRVVERQGDVAAVRTLPIKQDLKSYLDYASQKSGVFYEVTSGGQSHDHGRTGTHRHDVDNPGTIGAADGKMYVIEGGKKRYLSINNEADQAQISEFTKRFSSVAPSAGVGAGYMGRGEARGQLFHFGGGNEQGDKTLAYEGPQWFREAHKAGTSIKPEDAQADFQAYQEQKMEAARKKAEAQLTEAPTPQNRSLRSYLDMKEQQASAPVEPEPISSMPDGGDLQTDAESLSVYQMDKNKLQRDDSIALDDGGKPVFTMNSKESMKFDPNTGRVEVDNGSKGLRNDPKQLGPVPEPTARDRHEEKVVQTTGPAAAAARAEGPPPQSSSQSTYDLSSATMSMTDNMFKSPSFERAIARTRFHNSGDAALGGHFDGKAANMV
jgi:hypothetical protein